MKEHRQKNCLEYVDALIEGADRLYDKTVEPRLTSLGFALEAERSNDRLMIDDNGDVYTVRHKLFKWCSHEFGRMVWFMLDSEIPTMSSIVACIALPPPKIEIPLFVMNLNLKLDLNSYNTIIGYRGNAAMLERLPPFIPKKKQSDPHPKLAKPAPQDFVGIRFMFDLDSIPINWSLNMAQNSLESWIEMLEHPEKTRAGTAIEYIESYKKEMLRLHDRKENVFDRVFGENWVLNLFRDEVFE